MDPITRRTRLGRADLVAALAAADDVTADAIAARLGLERKELRDQPLDAPPPDESASDTTEQPSNAAIRLRADGSFQPVRFWFPHSVVFHQHDRTETSMPVPAYRGWTDRPTVPPPFFPLTSWSELAPRLRRVLSDYRESRTLDVERAVRAIGRGQVLTRFPRERRRRWGPALMLLNDDSPRLLPFLLDRRLVRGWLARLLPAHAFGQATVGLGELRPRVARGSAVSWPPPPGTLVLAMSDLGALAVVGDELQSAWQELGRTLLGAGCFPLALFPGPLERCPPELAAVWRLIPWERPRAHDGRSAQERRDALLRLVSPASRIEPGLLRAARLLLPPDQADAATECDVWQHPALVGDSPAGATIELEQARALRTAFSRDEPLDRRRQLIRLIKAWRYERPPEIWFDELLNVEDETRGKGLEDSSLEDLSRDLEDARAYFHAFCHEADLEQVAGWPENDRDWLERIRVRSTDYLWADPMVGRDLASRANELLRYRQDPNAASDAIRAEQAGAACRSTERWMLRQLGQRLMAVPFVDTVSAAGSALVEIGSRGGRLDLHVIEGADPCFWDGVWDGGRAPPWATDWGWDVYGAWVEFAIEDKAGQPVTQRMRWIEPGRFWMGSPEDELGRGGNEGPRHEVTIQEGFWLFEIACTQALWEAVTGENPSRFQGPERPVEQVSWNQVQGFIETINARLPGLALSLPSEARWEYACRAGSDTAFSFGETITPEQVNYAGNHQGTVPVKALPPNGWGLYQMHGNVDEWVQDAWHNTYKGAPKDGSAWESAESGALRVIRGGSWVSVARGCRSAFRGRVGPGLRVSNLGFRCARVQVRESGTPEAERVELARPGPRSGVGRGGTAPSRAAGQGHVKPQLLRLDIAASASVELPDAPGLEIRTDREILRLQRCAMPGWAKAMGRDRFGLWAEIQIEPVSPNKAPQAVPENVSKPVIQRLRWIPPGRFLMGSPEDEPGRWGDEGPQHSVTVGQGFWLFDTPCTQALWVALGLENPSRFQDPARPVEQVSWDEIQQRFLPALNERIPGFILPSEAQWEYACRAGTQTALYSGPIEIRGDMDAPDLDPIAWYGGNSGVNYDLADGEDTTSGDWWSGKQKQYPHERAGTRQVKGKLPNPWGLYDMLGNVLEWTQDAWHDSYEGAPLDSSAWESAEFGALRVIRGGSWLSDARYCRSAYRFRDWPDYRYCNLGFRCARVQVL
ncbi:hypothetical protein McPS_32430 [Marichromatium sp. PS1]|uniref:SUMF1/EgtB/PvdO family nonheme iron enzyme n=1 Tax=Marichromatium sp. PS1 TaxID=3138932 RepID=UPI0032E769ED